MKRYDITLRDIGKAALITLIGNLIALIVSLPEDQLPTWIQIKSNLIMSVKFGFLPYIAKQFFTDQEKAAKKTLDNAEKEEDSESVKIVFWIIGISMLFSCGSVKKDIYSHKSSDDSTSEVSVKKDGVFTKKETSDLKETSSQIDRITINFDSVAVEDLGINVWDPNESALEYAGPKNYPKKEKSKKKYIFNKDTITSDVPIKNITIERGSKKETFEAKSFEQKDSGTSDSKSNVKVAIKEEDNGKEIRRSGISIPWYFWLAALLLLIYIYVRFAKKRNWYPFINKTT